MWQIWIDTGGTFTDCISIDPNNRKAHLKILSSAVIKCKVAKLIDDDTLLLDSQIPITNIFEGYEFSPRSSAKPFKILEVLTQNIVRLNANVSITLGENVTISAYEVVPIMAARILTSTPLNSPLPRLVMRLGTTKGTNALLERKGAKVAFITTKGFKDLLKIGTQQRPNIFALNITTPEPLYKCALEVSERIGSNGEVIQPLNTELNGDYLQNLITEDYSFAVALMNSYVNPTHEGQVGKELLNMGAKEVTLSSNISSDIKIVPRATTSVVNAYLQPIMNSYLSSIQNKLQSNALKVMNSSGAILPSQEYTAKDSLLSGPAGGIIGAAYISKQVEEDRFVTFDMGGTSTDVSIYDQKIAYSYESTVGDATIQSPAVAIDTIAAGGGSICRIKNDNLEVGPESAGASPGPACYGENGPLTITDLNLLAGRISSKTFSIPINKELSRQKLDEIHKELNNEVSIEDLIESFLDIANEKMASALAKIAIRKGADISEFALTCFGGAGGQHACDIAEKLDINKIIIPYQAGILSALGIGLADFDRIISNHLNMSLTKFEQESNATWEGLKMKATNEYENLGYSDTDVIIKHKYCYLRFQGQESTIEIDTTKIKNLYQAFKEKYLRLYGHWVDDLEIEVHTVKLVCSIITEMEYTEGSLLNERSYSSTYDIKSLSNGQYIDTPVFIWEQLKESFLVNGPALVVSENCTVYVKPNWRFELDKFGGGQLFKTSILKKKRSVPKEALRTLYQNRLANIVEQMGAALERSSFSVNVKERLDFSCALLDRGGRLIMNAPHIPVHLGSMGVCVRKVIDTLTIEKGDIIITNHPAFGGSHLPDVTLISVVFINDELICYLSNRAHHSEIGGKTPGSMPTDASTLEEEGVIIPPTYLFKKGKSNLKNIEKLLSTATFPSRSVTENLADIKAGIASLNLGIALVKRLSSQYGKNEIQHYMSEIYHQSSILLNRKIKPYYGTYTAEEKLDDGSVLKVKIDIESNKITFNFKGSSDVHKNNLNATDAIVQSVILYILRILADDNIPLNEGLIENVDIILPEGMLNPNFEKHVPPAVVGGNTEISQRLTDTIIKALGLAACSQGTMNNLLFGNKDFGYYETIAGGTGAGPDFNGHDAIHQHMTNTKITDPEILELRYPVRLDNISIREKTGGNGKYQGGNGLSRTFLFNAPLKVTILSQHRKEKPYGLHGGEEGKVGEQYLTSTNGEVKQLDGICQVDILPGEKLTINTPGGGGFGSIE